MSKSSKALRIAIFINLYTDISYFVFKLSKLSSEYLLKSKECFKYNSEPSLGYNLTSSVFTKSSIQALISLLMDASYIFSDKNSILS